MSTVSTISTSNGTGAPLGKATTQQVTASPRPASTVSNSSSNLIEIKAEAGVKRPQSTRTTKDGEQLSEKKLRRLEKNRLSARECRRRKREATENLEREINILEGENLRLRLQLQIGEEAEQTNQQEQKKLTESLDELLKSGASESEIYAKIEEYKEKFADYGRDRRSAIEFHLRNIERLLKPTQTTNVVLVTLQGGGAGGIAGGTGACTAGPAEAATTMPVNACSMVSPSSTEASASDLSDPLLSSIEGSNQNIDPKSLFKRLVQILEVTPEQAAALKDSRFVAKEMDECLKASLAVLKELRVRLTQCGEDLEAEFNSVRSILTPTQAAKFLVWVANNSACMHMLNELWSKVYPETPDTADDSGEGSP